MATIQSSIQLQDRMTPVLQSITNAMNLMYSSFTAAQAATSAGLDTASMDAARQAMANASAEVIQYQEAVERAAQVKIPPPVQAAPTWESVQTPQVFMDSGAERFAQEVQTADHAAQQLYKTQQMISQQIQKMAVMPPGMLNDITTVENRMQALSQRVQQLNSIPVDLRTEQTNNDLETLRGQLGQAASIQNELSKAMSCMDISVANAAYKQLNSTLDIADRKIRALSVSSPAPAEPLWQNIQTPQVYMSSGAERFAQEFRAADQMAQQLYKTQQMISQQARQMKVTPPGMLNDVASVENRMQALSLRIRQINNIPVNLRTEQTNNELEALRGKLNQAVSIQEQLNAAMGRMDISAANAAYQQLNSVMDSTERDIRNNMAAQDQFNQSIKVGQNAAGGLESTIKRYAAAILSVATAGKAISIADEMTQTTARLNLMNQQFGETGNLQQQIYKSAQRSRGAYRVTADAVARLGMQARGAFKNTQEVVAFTEQLNKSFVIAGTSAQGIESVMLQLTQSMAAGKLQGEELNAVLDNAQPIVQNIADYMGVPVGQIKRLASEGAISAEIIKNAMFAAANETDAKFSQMPVTFRQAADNIKNQALMAFQPALQQLSAITQTEGFKVLVDNITGAIQTIASGAVQALDLMGRAALWVQENWGTIEPVIWGVAAAVGFNALVMGGYAVATGIADLAAKGFFTTLLTNPLTWLVILIGMTVAAIVKWVQSVGGLKIAWMICVNSVKTKAEQLMLAFSTAQMNVQNSIDNMQYGFANFKAGVLNALGNLKAKGLMLLQNFVNGAIDAVNRLINAANSIPGVAIKPISWVADFGSNAVIEEAGKQQQRAAELAELDSQNRADKKARAVDNYWKKYEANQSRMKREAEMEAAKNDAAAEAAANDYSNYGGYTPYTDGAGGDIANNTGSTAANTAAMADSMDVLDEDLKYMRDAAEQEIINRFTLAELKVDVNNNNTLKTQTDFDSVNRMLADVTAGILAAAAEGGHI